MSSSSAQQSKSSAAATNLKTKTKAQAEEATPTSATVTSTIEQVLRAAAIASIALMLLRAADERMPFLDAHLPAQLAAFVRAPVKALRDLAGL